MMKWKKAKIFMSIFSNHTVIFLQQRIFATSTLQLQWSKLPFNIYNWVGQQSYHFTNNEEIPNMWVKQLGNHPPVRRREPLKNFDLVGEVHYPQNESFCKIASNVAFHRILDFYKWGKQYPESPKDLPCITGFLKYIL